MKSMNKVVLVLMNIFSLLNLAACGEQNKEVAEKITLYLDQKYGEEFVVDKIGGGYGTITSNTIRAIAYPKESPHQTFQVEISKDLKTVWDTYMNIVIAESLDQELTKIINEKVTSEFRIKSYLTSNGLSFPNQDFTDKTMEINQYLDDNVDVSIFVMFEHDADVTKAQQAETLYQIANAATASGVTDTYIWGFNVSHSELEKVDQLQDILSSKDKAYHYFSEASDSYTWVRIKDSKILQSIEEIQHNYR